MKKWLFKKCFAESTVVSGMVKQLGVLGMKANAYHLRTSDGLDIDLLVELLGGYIVLEIKEAE